MFERVAGELRAKLLGGGGAWPAPHSTTVAAGVEGAGGTCRGAGGRRRGLAGLRDDAPSEARSADDSRAGRRPRAHKAARPDSTPRGARNTSGATRRTATQTTQTRGSPRGPPRVHATRSDTQHSRECKHSTQSKVQALSTVESSRTQRNRAATTSATWTALRAAPLRRLSPETTRTRPRLPSTA